MSDFCHKKGKGFGKRTAHPNQIFLGVAPTRGYNRFVAEKDIKHQTTIPFL